MMDLIAIKDREIERLKEEIKETETTKVAQIKGDQDSMKREIDEIKNEIFALDIKKQEILGELQKWLELIKDQDDKIAQIELEKGRIEV